tara:strand:+ start:1876 stop:2676 length:801 start_codon:yes stop_codon:yes gene_type:complete
MDEKILFISGNLIKHKFLAIKTLKKFKNMKIIFEKYPKNIEKNYVKKNSLSVKEHFKNVTRYEKKYFKKYVEKNNEFLRKRTLFQVKKGYINNQNILNEILNYNPKLIVINATSILSKKFIKFFKNKIINVHAGILPYYRGSGCNVWPFYYNELEYVGMTIHFVNSGLDTGNIILQLRSNFSAYDNTHSVGCKNTISSINLLNRAIRHVLKKSRYRGKKIKSKFSRLCLKKEFNKHTITRINKNLFLGIVKKYLKKSKKIKIVDQL